MYMTAGRISAGPGSQADEDSASVSASGDSEMARGVELWIYSS